MALQINPNSPYSIRLGVVGAGTMGSGIALAALMAGMPVTLYEINPEVRERASNYIQQHLQRKNKIGNLSGLELTADLERMGGAGVVIEAIPEDLALKHELFARLDSLCPPPAILATNTSTLAVTAIAAAVSTPERVAGMHFFNPAPVMPLIEIICGARTSPETADLLVTLGEMLGKTPIVAKDTPGFIVNKVARPFYGEALRLLGDQVASHADIDLLLRLSGGFRMGPFQLMDLIGIDINLAATQSMYEQTFNEPRYRPHWIQAQMVQQKALGRKSGRGFYDYAQEPPFSDPEIPRLAAAPPTLRSSRKNANAVYFSQGSWAPGLAELCRSAGYALSNGAANTPRGWQLAIVSAGRAEDLRKIISQVEREIDADTPILVQCADATVAEIAAWLKQPSRLVGFDGLFAANGSAITLVANPVMTPHTRSQVNAFVSGLGRLPVWVEDSPGLVLPRIVAMLANEAAFAVGEGVADAAAIDKAMQLGVNYPKGPLAWAKQLGYGRVVTVLDFLHAEFGEDRYRVAPLLRRWARLDWISS